ncbi:MFS transporter [Mycobacterium cookii]|uniref:MFS transporter n=1 Tax=Mycobacterium cookii TaxID=1775 RepID=A0A7I7L0F8_9MYCO|nr:MFS transporter [Mycobacterium cookii]MCV7330581.1 MFS transporter [Mycobacterium cookii]BBX47228.1 MFS transporter [Mycobacterium cookii]
MTGEQSEGDDWTGHTRGSAAYGRLLAALFCAGVATFAQLYSPQAVLPLISTGLGVGAAKAALVVSASTVGLAIGVIPWSALADRIGRVKAITISVSVATLVGMLVPFSPAFSLLLAGRFVEGLMVGGVPAIAVAYLTEEVDPVHAARAAGIFVGGTTIGGLLGRLVSGPVAEVAGWRVGVFTVAVICGMAAMGFVKLAPDPRGFVPASRLDANPEGSLGHRLVLNMRTPRQLVLFAQGFLLMGGFVALYNFLGFHLLGAPFNLAPSVVNLIFVAYLAGTWASSRAGAEAARLGRKHVLLAAVVAMMIGVAMTLSDNVITVLGGLLVATAGFFGAHSTASGWTGQTPVGKAQASSLYNLFYYGGSSAIGWLGGVAFDARGWTAVAAMILACTAVAGALAALFLHND